MDREEFVVNHLWPTLGGLALALLQALSVAMGPNGFNLTGKQLLFTLASAAVGYFLTAFSRYGGEREPYIQPPK